MSYYQYYPLVCTAKDTQSEAASGSACITVSNTITGQVCRTALWMVPCSLLGRSPTGCAAEATSRPPQSQPSISQCWLGTQGPALSLAACKHSPSQAPLSNRKEVLVAFVGHYTPKLYGHSSDTRTRHTEAVSVELALPSLRNERAEHCWPTWKAPQLRVCIQARVQGPNRTIQPPRPSPLFMLFLPAEKPKEQRMAN